MNVKILLKVIVIIILGNLIINCSKQESIKNVSPIKCKTIQWKETIMKLNDEIKVISYTKLDWQNLRNYGEMRNPKNNGILIKNVSINNLVAINSRKFSIITGLENYDVGENIFLRNISIENKGGGKRIFTYRKLPEKHESDGVYPDPAYLYPGVPPVFGFFCRYINGVTFDNVSLTFNRTDRRAAVICEKTTNVVFINFYAEKARFGAPSIIFRDQHMIDILKIIREVVK